MVECTGLENRRARKGSAGSNPAPSVSGLCQAAPGSVPKLGRKPPSTGCRKIRVWVIAGFVFLGPAVLSGGDGRMTS